ncbi:hypothetical protein BDW42DRAFT_198421 [Aspergillus taichungensis]|uniref:Ketoacyl-synt-domain-containing protein n=1 Tax=Aspergillus taichungensis TaxID=482145 RepID=A0A2J5IAL3_9EURO|nr:hypothetical protein BDW42DRAFT_198421 [Aspergillus taichungensis]
MNEQVDSPHQVAFFGGQGSRTIFARDVCDAVTQQTRRSATASSLLDSCYEAFLDELSIAKEESTDRPCQVLLELTEVMEPDNLLSPPVVLQSNPIMEGISLLIHQLLAYLRTIHTKKTGDHSRHLVATSASTQDFQQSSKQAVRLAFWLGYRVSQFGEQVAGDQWRASPWTMILGGITEQDTAKFNAQNASDLRKRVCWAAQLGDDRATITGTASALEAFATSRQAHADTIPVHGWYHGGEATESVVTQILQDLSRRSISIVSSPSFVIPLRSVVDGSFLTDPGTDMLVEYAIRAILTYSLDWQSTWKMINQNPKKVEVYAIGPYSRSFFKDRTDNVHLIDCFKPETPVTAPDDIAIVGMSVNFPGATDKDSLWTNLEHGVNTVEQLTVRCRPRATARPATHGNFVNKPWAFDHAFFGISPREARSMDPQQKMLLHGALHALNDAGYVPDATFSFQQDSMGCYIGIATGDYVDNLRDSIDVYYSTGTLRAFLSGKISYAFKLSGPSVVVDTACSASSVALYQGCRALINGDCTAALVGGANAILSPDMSKGLGRAHFLSPTGQCKTFDAAADGYCRSEGCGVFVIKRLSDALAENDRIYGVIRGVAVNQSANTSSITRPHSATQEKLFRSVLSRAGIEASSIDVVEAHGTGTQAGDAVEMASIHSVFGSQPRRDRPPVFVTSIKSNIGHVEAASGAASLAKVLLMFQKGKIPPQIGLRQVNPRVAAAMSANMQITTKAVDWTPSATTQPRRALLNNFGAAGSNVAIVLEQAQSRTVPRSERSAYPFIASAHTSQALRLLLGRYHSSVETSRSNISLADVCYTTTARRRRYEHVTAVLCRDWDDLITQLQDPLVTRVAPEKRPLVVVFSGQGSSYSGMGRALLTTSPVYRATVDKCERLLQAMGFPSIMSMLSGEAGAEESTDTYLSQTATFVLQYALYNLWESWGIRPHTVCGHSLGEYAAMVVAGVLSLSDGLRLVAIRATAIAGQCSAKETGMLACNLGHNDIIRIISCQTELSHLELACENTPQDSVVAGPIPELHLLADLLRKSGHRCKLLAVPYGFHSAAMDPVLEELRRVTRSITYGTPRFRVGSTVYGDFVHSTPDADYFLHHSRDPVRFAPLLQAIATDRDLSSAVFVEIGPSAISLPMVRAGLPNPTEHQFVSSLSDRQCAWEMLTKAAMELTLCGIDIHWRQFFAGTGAAVVDAPSYPLELSETYVPYRQAGSSRPNQRSASAPKASTLNTGLLTRKLHGIDGAFETPVDHLAPYIEGHIVGGVALCPASIYFGMVLEAASVEGLALDQVVILTELTFDTPLVYNLAPDGRIVQLRLTNDQHFRFSSCTASHPKDAPLHCSGRLSTESRSDTAKAFARRAAIIRRQLLHLERRRDEFDTFRKGTLYETIFSRVVRYARRYQTIHSLTIADSGLEGYGSFKVSDVPHQGTLSPTFVDTLLHSVGFMANSRGAATDVYICVKVESAKILVPEIKQDDMFSMYCSLLSCDENVLVADSYALSPSGTLVAAVEGVHFKKLNLRAFHNHLSRFQNAIEPAMDADSMSETSVHSDIENMSSGQVTQSTPPESEDEADAIPSLTATIIANICGINAGLVEPSTSLRDLGVDSLMSIEICTTLNKRLPSVHLDSTALMDMCTIGELNRHMQTRTKESDQPPTDAKPNKVRRNNGVKRERHHRPPPSDRLREILAKVCGISPSSLRPETSLGACGVDSLLSMEVRDALKRELLVDVPAERLQEGRLTVEALGSMIDSIHAPGPDKIHTRAVTPIQPRLLQNGDPESLPLILLHDGSGSVAPYSKLHAVDFPVYGVASPSLAGDGPKFSDLRIMATQYAGVIDAMFDGPVILGGWSFGGVLAYQVAQELRDKVKGIILIDSPSPICHQPLPAGVVDYVLRQVTPPMKTTLQAQFEAHASLLAKFHPAPNSSPARFVLLQSEQLFDTTRLCRVPYAWLESAPERARSLSQWTSLIGTQFPVLPIPGNHFQPFHLKNVATVTERVVEAYNYVTREAV